jgi:polyhydroxybutyrate depolymerase
MGRARTAAAVAVAAVTLVACGSRTAGEEAEPDPETSGTGRVAPTAPGTAELATTTIAPLTGPGSPGCTAGAEPTLGSPTNEPVFVLEGERNYLQYVPTTYDPAVPTPLVVDLHGFVTGALIHSRLTDLDALAEQEGYITVTPDGIGPSSGLDDGNDLPIWNVGGSADLPDDREFVLSAVDQVAGELCVDLARVYIAGLSNGAHLASTILCQDDGTFAAMAAVAGFVVPSNCNPERPVPLIAFHGTQDDYVGFEGGLGDGLDRLNPPEAVYEARDRAYDGVSLRPITATAEAWANRNGCVAAPVEEEVTEEVTRIEYGDCAAPVELFVVNGGGQTWPGSELFQTVESTSGYTTMDISANQLMWEFFQAHPLY